LRLLINKANGYFVAFRFRQGIEAVLAEAETPLAICMVSAVWINRTPVLDERPWWLLTTDRQLVIVRASFGKPHCQSFPLDEVVTVTEFNGRDFGIHLADGTSLSVLSRPWPDKKFTVAFRDQLTAQIDGGERKDITAAP
jgi:hypothetical protein